MKTGWLCLVVCFAAGFSLYQATAQAPQKPEELAQKSAEAWLVLTDGGRFAESWDEAAAAFKAAVTKEQWIDALQKGRRPLGTVGSRKLKNATHAKNPPGAPSGEYVIMQYDTNFENKSAAVETITPMLDKDGKWRVSGYFVK
jgi:hypothetical protein